MIEYPAFWVQSFCDDGMKKLVPKSKMSKKTRKALDDMKRVTWGFAPATRKVESAKRYKRAKPGEKKQWHHPSGEEP